MRNFLIAASLCLLAGCATISEVVPEGNDTYSVGYQVRGGMESWVEIKQHSLERANAFCAGKGLTAESVKMETHGVRGLTPQESDLTFKCVPSGP